MSKSTDAARDFFRALKGGDIAPIYYVHGEETYLMDKAVQDIIEAACPGGPNAFNFDSFHGKSASGSQIRAAVEMLPMMAARRVVVVRDLQDIALSELGALDDYFDAPSPSTCLVLHARTTGEKSLDGRNATVKKLVKAARAIQFKALYENEVGAFLQKQAQSRALRLAPEAEAYLIEAVGTDLASLEQAIEKVDLYLGAAVQGPPRTARLEDVEAVIAHTRTASVFELTDALGQRDLAKALSILERSLHAGEPAIRMAAAITRHFRILARLHDPALRQLPQGELAQALKVAPFFVRNYQGQARQFTGAQVQEILARMLEVDKSLKSSGLSDRTVMEWLAYDICVRHESAGAPTAARRR